MSWGLQRACSPGEVTVEEPSNRAAQGVGHPVHVDEEPFEQPWPLFVMSELSVYGDHDPDCAGFGLDPVQDAAPRRSAASSRATAMGA